MNTLLITGATGNVGSELAQLLASAPCRVRAAVSPGRVPKYALEEQGEYVPPDFTQPATDHNALTGVSKVFLLRPPVITTIKGFINLFVDAARQAGAQHSVLLSLLGAEKHTWLPHRKIEKCLETAGISWTFCAPAS